MAIPSELVAFTYDNKAKDVADAIFNEFPFFKAIQAKSGMKLSGGNQIARAFEYAKNGTVAAISGADVIDTSAQTVFSEAKWDWREYVGSVTITAQEMAKNNGKEEVINLLEQRIENLTDSFRDKITTDLFSAYPSAGSKSLENLAEAVPVDPTANPTRGSYGGISRTVVPGTTTWRNKYITDIDSTKSAGDLYSFASSGLSYLRTGYNVVSSGPSTNNPNFHLTTRQLYEAYHAQAGPHLQLMRSDLKAGDLGFTGLSFMGVPVVWDAGLTGNNTAGHKWYMFNMKFWEMITHTDWNFKRGPFQEPVNQTVLSAKVVWQGNVICRNPVRQLVIEGFTV